jgi:hypothetical protein
MAFRLLVRNYLGLIKNVIHGSHMHDDIFFVNQAIIYTNLLLGS